VTPLLPRLSQEDNFRGLKWGIALALLPSALYSLNSKILTHVQCLKKQERPGNNCCHQLKGPQFLEDLREYP